MAAFVLRAVWLWNYYTLSVAAITGSGPMTLGIVQTVAALAVGLVLAVLVAALCVDSHHPSTHRVTQTDR